MRREAARIHRQNHPYSMEEISNEGKPVSWEKFPIWNSVQLVPLLLLCLSFLARLVDLT